LEITLGDRVWTAVRDEEIFIPRRAAHRVRNVGREPARIMEVWLGPSSESDIVRLSDDYDRK
jgi:mannose-6-phosphate isomerase